MKSIAIIGGGIIGLSIGWQLARENILVHIFDQRRAGMQASWAAAGMLSPYCEAAYGHSDALQIGKQSLSLYPSFLKELSEDSDIILPKESEGTLCVAINRDDREWLHRQYIFKKKNGMPVYWLSGDEARQKEPLLSPRVNSGIWIPSERQINNHLLIEALKDAFVARGGTLTEMTKITELLGKNGNNGLKIQTENGQSYCVTSVINTTGAWANQIDPSLTCQGMNICPIKGQLLNLKMQSHLLLKGMIRSPRIYLAPKQDGNVRVGATSEDQGYNEDITAGATLELLEHAWEIIPAISEFKIEGITVGLRPMTANHMPFIGASSLNGIYHAIGHGRSGILLAPYTAYLIKKLITKDDSDANFS
jgi:glycine oxidase